MSNLIAGDEVVFTHPTRWASKGLAGKYGTVVGFTRGEQVCVLWKDWDNGHDAALTDFGIKGGSRSSWWVRTDDVELIGGVVENE